MIKEEYVSTLDAAKSYLRRQDVSAARLDNSLKQFVADSNEISLFATFLNRWPMYMEGSDHINVRRSVIGCMIKTRELVPALRIQFINWIAKCPQKEDISASALNSIWQTTIMGVDTQNYELIVPHLDAISDFFSCKPTDFDFAKANAAVEEMRRFVEIYEFAPGSLIGEGKRIELHTDVLVNLLVDPRPSMHGCIETILRIRNETNDFDLKLARTAVETALKVYPPFDSIYRVIRSSDGDVTDDICISIEDCNQVDPAGVGLTFGFGRHSCPAGGLVTDSLVALWEAVTADMSCPPN
jgi:hypothetical protein